MDPLASIGELENHLQRELDDQAGAQFALVLASGAVRAYCGWVLSRETTTFHVDGQGGAVLTLPTLNLVSVTAVRINGLSLDLTLPRYDPGSIIHWRKGQLRRNAGWPTTSVIEVDAVHGYEQDSMPDVVKLCVLDVAARRITNPEGLVSATTSAVSRTWTSNGNGTADATLTALHERLLDRHSI